MNNNPLRKGDKGPVRRTAACYVEKICFDMNYDFIKHNKEQATITPGKSAGWESESYHLIPGLWWEYTRVSKKDPDLGHTVQQRIDEGREKVMRYASAAEIRESELRVVKDTIVKKLYPDIKAIYEILTSFLIESHDSLETDTIASLRKTREMPAYLKEKRNSGSRKKSPISRKGRAR